MSELAAAPDAVRLLLDLRELRSLAAMQNFDLFVFLRELGDDGAPILGTDIDVAATVPAGDAIQVYKLPKGVKALLAALRVGMVNRDSDEIEGGSSEFRRHEEAPG